MLNTTVLYVHYTSINFRALVEAGQASWEAVEYPAKKAKTLRAHVLPVDAVPELDHYGFPQTGPPKGLLKKGNATLFQCIAAAKPADYLRSSSDPTAVRLPDGSWSKLIGFLTLVRLLTKVQSFTMATNVPQLGASKPCP